MPEEPSPPETRASLRLGEFEIVRELGRGGMGVVYEAEQLSLKRRVALKVLPPGLGGDARLLARFQREAEAAARLRHPGIVPVYSFGDSSGTPYFAMELVEGRSLAEILRARRAGEEDGLPPRGPGWIRWAVATVARVADALAYAHEQGILHRDVKPGNILIERDGTPRLTDFGLALDARAEGLTQSGEVFGSLQYMSPEQAFRRGGALDGRADVYSLAVTLYELVTLRLPYAGKTTSELLAALESGAIVPPRTVEPEVPEALERVLLHALAGDREQRYADAASFAADLRALAEARPVAAPPRASSRRRRFLAAVAVLVVAGAGGGIAWNRCTRPTSYRTQWNRDLVAAGVPTAEEIRALADGTLADGSARLARWIQPQFFLGRVLARQHLGSYHVYYNLELPTDLEDGLIVSAEWRVSVAGGPWRVMGSVEFPLQSPAIDGFHFSANPSVLLVQNELAWLLDGALERGSVEVVHEGTIRVRRVSRVGDRVESQSEGTSATITDRRVLLIYDDYPPDYPEQVSAPDLDPDMRTAYTPIEASYGPTVVLANGEKTVPVTLKLKSFVNTIPVAAEVDLYWNGREGVSATGEFAWPGGRETGPIQEARGTWGYPCTFTIAPMPPEEEARLMLELDAGRMKELHFVMHPSRSVALEHLLVDRYWGGTLEATVPLVRAP